jgi:hypothetical protein
VSILLLRPCLLAMVVMQLAFMVCEHTGVLTSPSIASTGSCFSVRGCLKACLSLCCVADVGCIGSVLQINRTWGAKDCSGNAAAAVQVCVQGYDH